MGLTTLLEDESGATATTQLGGIKKYYMDSGNLSGMVWSKKDFSKI